MPEAKAVQVVSKNWLAFHLKTMEDDPSTPLLPISAEENAPIDNEKAPMEMENVAAEDPPPIPPVLSPLQEYKWLVAKAILLVILNVAAIHPLLSMPDNGLGHVKTSCIVGAIVFAIDGFVLYRSATVLEKAIHNQTSLRAEDNTAAGGDPKLVTSIEKFLRGGQSNSRHPSIVLGLIFLLAAVSLIGFCVTLALRVFAETDNANRLCNRDRSHESNLGPIPNITQLPDDIEDWASRLYNTAKARKLDSFHMLDGRTFFTDSDNSMLISTTADGTLTKHETVRKPYNTLLVRGKDILAAELVCCIYREQFITNVHTSKILCIRSGTATFQTITSPVRQTEEEPIYEPQNSMVFSKTDGHVWFGTGKRHWQKGYLSTDLQFYRLDPLTMRLDWVTTIDGIDGVSARDVFSLGPCRYVLGRTSLAISSPLFTLAGIYIFKVKGFPAGTALMMMALFSFLGAINPEVCAFVLLFCGPIAVVLGGFLNGFPVEAWLDQEESFWINREALLCWFDQEPLFWGFYLSLTFSVFLLPSWSLVSILLICVIGIVFSHPVLQVVGLVGGTLGFSIGIYMMIFFGDLTEGLVCIGLGIFGGFALVSSGTVLTNHQAFLCFYIRRMGREIVRFFLD